MPPSPEIPWRVGFEIEVILGDLDDGAFEDDLGDPMDVASDEYCRVLARQLTSHTGFKWKARQAGKRWDKPGFYVVSEYDLDPLHWPWGRVAGVELLTPPLPLEQAEEARSAIRSAIEEIDGRFNFFWTDTTRTCAWHINIDGGSELHLDAGQFAVAVDEVSVLQGQGRLFTKYTGLQRHAYGPSLLRHLAVEPRALLLDRAGLMNVLISRCGASKLYAANFDKAVCGYLELRHFSATSFFRDTPLQELLEPFTDALGMPANATGEHERVLLEKFRILSQWLKANRAKMSFEIGGYGFTHAHGRAFYDGEPLAGLMFNGTGELRLFEGEHTLGEYSLGDLNFANVPEGIALLALDLAELRLAGWRLRPIANAAFKKAVGSLFRKLKAIAPAARMASNASSWTAFTPVAGRP